MFHLNGNIVGFRSQVKNASNIERRVIFPWLDILGVKRSKDLGGPKYQGMIRINFLQEVVCFSCLKPGIRKAYVERRMTLKFGD